MRPWTSYCLSLSSGLEEIICALGNICHSETSDKESFSRFAKFYKIDGEVLEAEQKMYASFRCVRGLGHMTVSEMQRAIQEKVLFDTFPEFSGENGTYSCSETCYIVFCGTIIQCLTQIKTYFRSTMEQQRVSNIALTNIKRTYADSAVNNDIYHIVGRNLQRQICFLTCFTSLCY